MEDVVADCDSESGIRQPFRKLQRILVPFSSAGYIFSFVYIPFPMYFILIIEQVNVRHYPSGISPTTPDLQFLIKCVLHVFSRGFRVCLWYCYRIIIIRGRSNFVSADS